ncbi:hypothetical protein Mapa_003581 [Marchantia paleacea]|nr:hypothetical protein Mapa_003581 [Marchantia paleacea]
MTGIQHDPASVVSGSTSTCMSILLLLLLVILCYWKRQELLRESGKKLPPGPRAWPIVGSLWHLLGKLPHHAFRRLSEVYGPIVFLYIGSTPSLIVSSPKIVEEIFRNHDHTFDRRPATAASQIIGRGKSITFSHSSNYWRHARNIAARELLTRSRVSSYRGVRKTEMLELLRSLDESSCLGKPVVVRDKIFPCITNSFAQMMLQRKKIFGPGQEMVISKTEKELQDLVLEAVVLLGVFNVGDFIPLLKRFDIQGYEKRMRKMSREIDNLMGRILEEHKKASGIEDAQGVKDFMDILLSLPGQDGSPHLHEDMIKILPMEMIVSANDSTNATIEWALVHIVTHLRVKEKVQQELDTVVGSKRLVEESDLPNLKYLEACVKEVLRLHPPSPMLLPHESSSACTIAGCHIPKYTQLYINAYAIGRDATVWQNPDTFWPERFTESNPKFKPMEVIPGGVNTHFEFIPFGWGKRSCPGVNLGYLAVRMSLATILQCFDLRLPPGVADVDMQETYGISVFKAIPLQLLASLRVDESLILDPRPRDHSDIQVVQA